MSRPDEIRLGETMGQCALSPLQFVKLAFPWGEPGGPLADYDGPRHWQRMVMVDIEEAMIAGYTFEEAMAQAIDLARPYCGEVIQEAAASGHGIGKSALVAWLILWAMSTRRETRGVVTANTESQLRTKTWPELVKWHSMCISRDWFKVTPTAIHATGQQSKTWRIDATPWSEHNTEAFAGLHNKGKRLLLIFDEASNIPDKVWEVAEGALTDENTEIIWCVFGNPTRNTGRFRECFGRLKHRWTGRQIDSREVDGTNKNQIGKWIDDHGEDSDFVRVRVRGVFPRAGSMQLIPSDLVLAATKQEAAAYGHDPLIMSLDVARFGDDQCVFRFRRGRDAKTIPPIKLRGVDLMTLAGRAAQLIVEHRPAAVFIDETGVGGGVVDRLRQLGHQVIGINFGAKPDGPVEGEIVANKRAEMWVRMRNWLKHEASIDDDKGLCADLEAVEYGFNRRNEIQLESKDDMKKRGLPSPDDGDALALTFAHIVAPPASAAEAVGEGRNTCETEYDIFNS